MSATFNASFNLGSSTLLQLDKVATFAMTVFKRIN